MPELGSIVSLLFWIVIIGVFVSRQKKRTGGPPSSNARDGARPTSASPASPAPAPPSAASPSPVAPSSTPTTPAPIPPAVFPSSVSTPPPVVSVPRTQTPERPRSAAPEATEPSPEVVAEVTALYQKGRMIDAIEVLRDATGMELYEASQFVRKLPR